jgi:hypothetical protein
MPKTNDNVGYILVRMSYQSPVDGHYETAEIAVPPTASDEYIDDAFSVYGKVRKIMAKRMVEMLNDPEALIAAPTQAPQGTPGTPNRTHAQNGGSKTNKAMVEYATDGPFNTIINFGKYAGQTLGQIEARDESYIDWLYENGREKELKTECNIIITLRGSPEYQTALNPPQAKQPEADAFDDQFDADLFPAD